MLKAAEMGDISLCTRNINLIYTVNIKAFSCEPLKLQLQSAELLTMLDKNCSCMWQWIRNIVKLLILIISVHHKQFL